MGSRQPPPSGTKPYSSASIIMLRFLVLAAASVAMASAAAQHRHPNSNQRQFQERQGFGVQGGFGAGDAFGVNAGLQVGDPLAGNNLLADVFVLWFPSKTDKGKNEGDDSTGAARSGREMTDMAFSVLDAIQNLQDKYATQE